MSDSEFKKFREKEIIKSLPGELKKHDDRFKPYNKFPVGMALFKAKEFLEKEGFKITEEPKEGNGWLSGSKYIGPEGTHHIIRAQFKSGQLVHALEMAIDP